jgi:hypothetical protein
MDSVTRAEFFATPEVQEVLGQLKEAARRALPGSSFAERDGEARASPAPGWWNGLPARSRRHFWQEHVGLAVASSAACLASSPAAAVVAWGNAATSATGPRAMRSESQVTGALAPVANASSACAMAGGSPGLVATGSCARALPALARPASTAKTERTDNQFLHLDL